MAVEPFNPMHVFASAFGVSSFAGLAALLRSGKPLSWLAILNAMLNTGLVGLGIALIWYYQFSGKEENIYFLIGVCVFAGLGGTTALDFVMLLAKKGGLSINIAPGKSDDQGPPKPSG